MTQRHKKEVRVCEGKREKKKGGGRRGKKRKGKGGVNLKTYVLFSLSPSSFSFFSPSPSLFLSSFPRNSRKKQIVPTMESPKKTKKEGKKLEIV